MLRGWLSAYIADLWTYSKRSVVLVLALSILVASTESAGLLILVPLVALLADGDGDASGLAGTVADGLRSVGVPTSLGWILVVYAGLMAIRTALLYARAITTANLRLGFVDHVRVRLLRAVGMANWRFHVERRGSDIAHAITADLPKIGTGTHLLFEATTRTIVMVGYGVVAFQISVGLSIVAVGLALLFALLLWPQLRRSRDLGVSQTAHSRRSFSEQSEFLSGIKLAKAHGIVGGHVDSFESELGRVRNAAVSFQRVTARTTATYQVGTTLALIVLVVVGFRTLDVPGNELIVLIVILARLASASSGIFSQAQAAMNLLPSYEVAEELRIDAVEAQEFVGPATTDPMLAEGIDVQSVTISYQHERPALDAVTVHIPAREVTAFVGPSGAGKTTLADVVLGLLPPERGEVLVDGTSLGAVGLEAWRRNLAYVPQDPFLLHDTIEANIAWGSPEPPSQAELDRVVNAASLRTLVDRLPMGLATVVGDRGVRLSGGERQRLALARALARKPQLLVLDEATSALDREHEEAIQSAIDEIQGTLTMVVIAHRLSTVRSADQLIVLDEGKVVERGTWDSLMASGGRLAALAGDHS